MNRDERGHEGSRRGAGLAGGRGGTEEENALRRGPGARRCRVARRVTSLPARLKDAPQTQTTTQGNVATHIEEPGSSSSSSYFNTAKERPRGFSGFFCSRPAVCMYDVLFHQPGGYDAHLHRDDRQHSKSRGLNVHAEEMARDVPVLSSSEYGRQPRVFVDPSDRQFARVGIVRAEFYRLNGSSLQHTGSCQN
ncbi:unnamed protein product [Lampetra fluviatilis]